MVCPILILHIGDNLVPALVTEINIKVRHTHPLRVQEALENQIIPDGVHIGDAQAVGGQAPGPRAPARAHGDAHASGIADKVPHNQVVVYIPHLLNGADFIFQPLLQRRLRGLPIPGTQALLAQAAEIALAGGAVRHIEPGQLGFAELNLHMAAPGNVPCAGQGLWVLGEQGLHLLLRLHVQLPGAELQASLFLHCAACLDAHKHPVHLLILGLNIVAVIGADKGDACLL